MSKRLDPQTAEEWFDSYGWHLPTERAGDVPLQSVEYHWLDEDSDSVVADRLLVEEPDLSEAEATRIIERARMVRCAAEVITALLRRAAARHERGDLAGAETLLRVASDLEIEHGGDDPATRALRAQIAEGAGR